MPEFLNTSQGALPAAANDVSVVGGSGTYGSYVELAAAAPSDLAVTGVSLSPTGFSPANFFTVEIAHGAGGAEVALAEFGGVIVMLSGTWSPDPNGCVIPALIPVKTITSGTRVAARCFGVGAAVTVTCAVTYVGLPLDGNLETTTSPLRITASFSATSGGSAWANGSYAQVTASTAAAWVVNHMVTSGGGASGDFEIGVATGAGGAEVEITTIATYNNAGTNTHGFPRADVLGMPFDNIAASTRVAVRLRDATASQTRFMTLGYYHKPI